MHDVSRIDPASAQTGGRAHTFGPGLFALIQHACYNASDRPVRWPELQAARARPPEFGRDTFFVDEDARRDGTGAPAGYFDVDRSFGAIRQPMRWIETQAPLPPAKEAFRFERDWAHLG
jgi:hypothetical protein